MTSTWQNIEYHNRDDTTFLKKAPNSNVVVYVPTRWGLFDE